IGALLARLFPSAGAQLPPGSVELILTIAGIGLLVVILAILVRGVRERIRREAVQPGAHAEAAASAAVQLAAAERAALSGDPRYVDAAVLVLVVVGLAIFVGTNAQSPVRSGSALDSTSGGAARLRALVDELGGRTVIVQGERFAPSETAVTVLLMLGASEFV